MRDGEVEVLLTAYEVELAAHVGALRAARSRAKNSTPRFAYKSEAEEWGQHIVGALAECAFAKGTGIYWPASVDVFRTIGDVGGFEVRWSNGSVANGTTYPPYLKIRNDERPETLLALVSGKAPRFALEGWLRAKHGMRPEFSKSPRTGPPAFFVPIEKLGPMYTLPREGVAVT